MCFYLLYAERCKGWVLDNKATGTAGGIMSGDKELILIVEDDRDISEMLCTFLRTKQYRLITTPMGEEVLDICRRENPGLILLDINLPDIDGYEVCRRLRANLATRSVPVIFLTQKREREDRLTGFESGGDDYITKPFDMEELYLRVNNILRRAKHRAGIDSITELPMGPPVEAQLKSLLNRDNWALVLVAVEGLEEFLRTHAHLKEKLIGYVAQIVKHSVDQVGNFEDFVGRVGVAEFIIITTPPRVARLKERINARFTRAMNPPGTGNGRRARPATACLSLSFGVITDRNGPFGDVRSLAEAVARSRRPA